VPFAESEMRLLEEKGVVASWFVEDVSACCLELYDLHLFAYMVADDRQEERNAERCPHGTTFALL